MSTGKNVTNGGSAIGEAIGSLLEQQVHKTFREIEENNHVYFITKYGTTKTGKESKKLLLPDEYGNEYNMDGLVIDEGGIPLMLVESKYIRYKKHNRDKASWICNAHSAVRRFFPSIRSSVAVLAGNWSASSLAMLTSYDISYFMVPFNEISLILKDYGIDFEWDENDYDKALASWENFSLLNDNEKQKIGERMINTVKDKLTNYIEFVLDDAVIREVKKIIIEIHTNKNEVFKYNFDSKEEAIEFLMDFDETFDLSQFKSIFQHKQ